MENTQNSFLIFLCLLCVRHGGFRALSQPAELSNFFLVKMRARYKCVRSPHSHIYRKRAARLPFVLCIIADAALKTTKKKTSFCPFIYSLPSSFYIFFSNRFDRRFRVKNHAFKVLQFRGLKSPKHFCKV